MKLTELEGSHKALQTENIRLTAKLEAMQAEVSKLHEAHAVAFQDGFTRGFQAASASKN